MAVGPTVHLVMIGKDDSRLWLGCGTRSVGGEGEPRGGHTAIPLSLHHPMESEAACSSAPDGPPPCSAYNAEGCGTQPRRGRR
jgi:hypothetical protein